MKNLKFLLLLIAHLHAADIWIDGDYLYWWLKDSPTTVPLVVQSGIVPNRAPVLGRPGASVVLGDKSVDTGPRSGGKFDAGVCFERFGVEGGYLFLCTHGYKKTVSSSGLPGSATLTIPYINAVTSAETSTFVAFPGNFSGTATLNVANRMQDAELNGLYNLIKGLDLFAGFLWWNFKENLSFTTSSPQVEPPIDVYNTRDQFKTINNFYGGQLGVKGNYCWKRLSFQLKGQVALGAMASKLKINGSLVTNDFNGLGAPETFGSGYFAQATNRGHYSKTNFSVIPQVNVQLGLEIFKWLSTHVGYTFLYATEVMWASNQIDRTINISQSPAFSGTLSDTLVGPARPKPLFNTNSFWAQGLNVGLEFFF